MWQVVVQTRHGMNATYTGPSLHQQSMCIVSTACDQYSVACGRAQQRHRYPPLDRPLNTHLPSPQQAEPPVNVRFVVALQEGKQWKQVTWACEPCQTQEPLQRLMAQVMRVAGVIKPGIKPLPLFRSTAVKTSDSPASLGLQTGQFIMLFDIQQVRCC